MANPDIRIRLSAEGVQEVVTALRKVQAALRPEGGRERGPVPTSTG